MKILGILNITEDSFSDGGKYLAPEAALAQAGALARDGADIIDIGAASSNPDAKPVSPQTEIARLASVVPALKAKSLPVSIDSFAPQVQRWALAQGVDYLNDIHGFPDPSRYPMLAASKPKLIVMHSVQAPHENHGIATRQDVHPGEIFAWVTSFFDARIAALEAAGIARDRLILDPGMGFFLGTDPQTSLTMLRRLPDIAARYRLPLLVSVSRKSFLRKLTGAADSASPNVLGASLAAEFYAQIQGAAYIRTHAPGALRGGLTILQALQAPGNRQ